MNDGLDGALDTEITAMDARNPSLNSFEIDLSTTGVVGRIYKFKIRAENINGDFVETNALSLALASLPSKPPTTVYSDDQVTNTQTLGVYFDIFTTSENGGSEILNYELQYDDGYRGSFMSVIQLANRLTISEGVVASQEYRFRYRAQNFNGWGPFSDISYYIAATVPNRPPPPLYISSTATTTTLQFIEPEILGGSPLTSFILYVDTLSALQTEIDYVMIYNGTQTQYTVTDQDAGGLTTGTIYRYVLKANNVFGASIQSEEIRVALGSLPIAPNAPTKVEELSG
jgi:hypothetical protein